MADKDNPLTGVARDIERINEATAGAVVRFGKLGGVSKSWTAFARVTSGSLAWKVQARLRALMNVVELITDRQASFNVELADSFRKMNELESATKNIRKFKNEFKAMQDALIKDGFVPEELLEKVRGTEIFDALMLKYKDNINEVVEKGLDFLTYQTKKADKATAMNEAGGFFKYHAQNVGKYMKNAGGGLQPEMRRSLAQSLSDPNFGPLTKPKGGIDTIKSIQVGFTKAFRSPKIFTKILGGLRPSAIKQLVSKNLKMVTWTNRRKSFNARRDKLFMKIGNGLKLLPKLIGLSLGALGTVMLYGSAVLIGLLIVIAIIRKAWPILRKGMSMANKFAGIGMAFFWGVSRILEGIMMVLSGLWEGDLIKVLKGLWFYVLPGILAVGYSIVAGIAALLVSLAASIVGGIAVAIAHILGKIGSYIPGMATGGLVNKGGIAVVGERGPELVSLPSGARVHPNGYGPSGSTVINVNVTGRVGASDAEIRDIANKVAREINLRMSRTGSGVNNF